jgi:hypothetical protein
MQMHTVETKDPSQGSHLSVYGTDSAYIGRSVRARSVRSLKQLNVRIFRKKPVVRIFRLKNRNFCKKIYWI